MYAVLLGIHIFICFLLVIAVLLQSGEGTSLSEAFGGGAGNVFGPGKPESVITKVTTVLVVIFFFTSIALSVLSSNKSGSSVINKMQQQPTQQQQQQQQNAPKVPLESK